MSGGIAIIGDGVVLPRAMPDTERDTWDVLGSLGDECFCVIERLGQMPRDKETGRAKQSPTTMLKMGLNYGGLRMALIGRGIPFEDILPVVWQRHFGLMGSSNESRTDKKNRHKAKAQQLFPHLKVTLKTCDALLIAEYCRRTRVEQRQKESA